MIQVVVGVITNKQGQVLVALRPENRHLAGYWEFPGGKQEPGETAYQALCRELQEELAIETLQAEPLLQHQHHYSEYDVSLDVWRVTAFNGTAVGKEGQRIAWHYPHELTQLKFPEANQVIIAELSTSLLSSG